MIQIDQELQAKFPNKYDNFLAVHGLPLSAIMLLFIKRIRRHGTITINLINLDGEIVDRFTFTLANKKETEGKTLMNGQEFSTIYEAWSWYEKKVIDLF